MCTLGVRKDLMKQQVALDVDLVKKIIFLILYHCWVGITHSREKRMCE